MRTRVVPTTFALALLAATVSAQRGTCRIEGSVRDVHGEPVPAAEIRVLADDAVIAHTASDGTGTFRLAHLPRAPVVVEGAAIGHARSTAAIDAWSIDGIAVVDLTLPPGGAVAGTVRGAGGAAVAGAEVVAATQDDRTHPARTDAAGRFLLDHLPLGEVQLYACAPGHVATRTACRITGEVAQDLLLQRGPGRRLHFPISGLTAAQAATARLELWCVETVPQTHAQLHWMLPAGATANCSGRLDVWEVHDLPPQLDCRIIELLVPGAHAAPGRIRLDAGEAPDGRAFRVEPFPVQSICGEVRGADGAPVAGLAIEIDGGSPHTVTAPDGTFAIDMVIEAGGQFTLRATDDAWVLADTFEHGKDAGIYQGTYHATTVDRRHYVRAFPATTLRGRVVDADGNPAAYARVRLECKPDNFSWWRSRLVVCDRDGRYELRCLDGSGSIPHRIVAETRGHRGIGEPFEMAVGAGQQVADVEIAPTARVVGRVLDNDGAPVAGAFVLLRFPSPSASSRPLATCTSDANGRFQLSELDPGVYQVWLRGQIATSGVLIRVPQGSTCTRDLMLPPR